MKEFKEVLEWKIYMMCVKKYVFKNGYVLKILKLIFLCLNDKMILWGKELWKMVINKILKNIVY